MRRSLPATGSAPSGSCASVSELPSRRSTRRCGCWRCAAWSRPGPGPAAGSSSPAARRGWRSATRPCASRAAAAVFLEALTVRDALEPLVCREGGAPPQARGHPRAGADPRPDGGPRRRAPRVPAAELQAPPADRQTLLEPGAPRRLPDAARFDGEGPRNRRGRRLRRRRPPRRAPRAGRRDRRRRGRAAGGRDRPPSRRATWRRAEGGSLVASDGGRSRQRRWPRRRRGIDASGSPPPRRCGSRRPRPQ